MLSRERRTVMFYLIIFFGQQTEQKWGILALIANPIEGVPLCLCGVSKKKERVGLVWEPRIRGEGRERRYGGGEDESPTKPHQTDNREY